MASRPTSRPQRRRCSQIWGEGRERRGRAERRREMSKRGRGTREDLTALCLLILCDVGEGKSGREGAPRALLLPCVESIVLSLERADPARRDLRSQPARGSSAGEWWRHRRAPRCVGTSRPPSSRPSWWRRGRGGHAELATCCRGACKESDAR